MCKMSFTVVGSTITKFRLRFRNHKSGMTTNKKSCEVAVHYSKSPHTLSDFTVQCIDQVELSSSSLRI